MPDFTIDTRPYQEICRECADEQAVYEEAKPSNGYHARHWKPHYRNPRLFHAEAKISTGEVEVQVYVDQEGAIKASVWLCVHGPGQPDGRGFPVHPWGADPHGEWSFVSPDAARVAAFLALVECAEELEVRARAVDCDASILGAMDARAWAVCQLGRHIPRRINAQEMAEAVAERRAWLEEARKRTAEIANRHTQPQSAQAEPQAETLKQSTRKPKTEEKENQYALF